MKKKERQKERKTGRQKERQEQLIEEEDKLINNGNTEGTKK